MNSIKGDICIKNLTTIIEKYYNNSVLPLYLRDINRDNACELYTNLYYQIILNHVVILIIFLFFVIICFKIICPYIDSLRPDKDKYHQPWGYTNYRMHPPLTNFWL